MGGLFSNSKPELRDLSNRVAIVTGANTGIGYYIVQLLARQGAKVYLGARNETKAKIAIEKLQSEGLGDKGGDVVWLDIDLARPHKATEAAEYVLSHEARLDILVNNAGRQITPYALTSDGFSESMATNHLSPFLFTNKLLPLMTSTTKLPDADVRIINTSSMMHSWIKAPKYDSVEVLSSDFSSLSNSKVQIYSYTKLANILHASELQRRLDTEKIPIVVMSVNPGGVWTDAAVDFTNTLPLSFILLKILRLGCVEPLEGAYTSAFAAASPLVDADPGEYKGKYLVPVGRVEKPNANGQNAQLAKDLWDSSDKALAAFQ